MRKNLKISNLLKRIALRPGNCVIGPKKWLERWGRSPFFCFYFPGRSFRPQQKTPRTTPPPGGAKWTRGSATLRSKSVFLLLKEFFLFNNIYFLRKQFSTRAKKKCAAFHPLGVQRPAIAKPKGRDDDTTRRRQGDRQTKLIN